MASVFFSFFLVSAYVQHRKLWDLVLLIKGGQRFRSWVTVTFLRACAEIMSGWGERWLEVEGVISGGGGVIIMFV